MYSEILQNKTPMPEEFETEILGFNHGRIFFLIEIV